MSYTITVPVDWLYVGGYVWIIEPASRIGWHEPAVFRNAVKGFSRSGFYYKHDSSTPVYHAEWSEIGKSVFETKEEAQAALDEHLKRRKS